MTATSSPFSDDATDDVLAIEVQCCFVTVLLRLQIQAACITIIVLPDLEEGC